MTEQVPTKVETPRTEEPSRRRKLILLIVGLGTLAVLLAIAEIVIAMKYSAQQQQLVQQNERKLARQRKRKENDLPVIEEVIIGDIFKEKEPEKPKPRKEKVVAETRPVLPTEQVITTQEVPNITPRVTTPAVRAPSRADTPVVLEYDRPEAAPESGKQKMVPMFKGKNLLDGEEISMEDLKGHVLIVDFWATWCPPCRQEIPGFIELHNKYKDRNFAVVGMSLDQGGEEIVKKFMKDNNMNYPIIMAGRSTTANFEKAIGAPISGIPTTLVVDRNGGIVSVHVGFRAKEEFEREIKDLLSGVGG